LQYARARVFRWLPVCACVRVCGGVCVYVAGVLWHRLLAPQRLVQAKLAFFLAPRLFANIEPTPLEGARTRSHWLPPQQTLTKPPCATPYGSTYGVTRITKKSALFLLILVTVVHPKFELSLLFISSFSPFPLVSVCSAGYCAMRTVISPRCVARSRHPRGFA